QLLLGDEAQRMAGDGDDGGDVEIRSVVGDEHVALLGRERRVALHRHPGAGQEKEEPRPGAQHAVGEVPLAGEPDQHGAEKSREKDQRPAEERAQKTEDDHLRYSSAAGKSSTSEMVSAPVSSISRRSTPTATPPASPMPSSAPRNSSSRGNTSRPIRRRCSCSPCSRARCSRESHSSEKPLASSSPPAQSSKRSATRGSSALRRASAACD